MALVDGVLEPAVERELRPRLIRAALGLAAGLVALFVVIAVGGGLADAVAILRGMHYGWVAVAIACAVGRIGALAAQVGRLARSSGPASRRMSWQLALVVFGVGAVTPAAPAEGLALAGHELTRRGRDRRTAVITLGLVEWFAQRAFYLVSAVNLLIVVIVGRLPTAESWPFALAAIVVIGALVITAIASRRPASIGWAAVVLGAIRFRRSGVPRDVRRQNGMNWHANAMTIAGPTMNRARLATWSCLAVVLDAATLWAACRATGIEIGPELVLLASTVGTMASWVPFLPSGLGVVEAVVPSILHRFGAPLDVALAATLTSRAAGTLLPALAGLPAVAALRRLPQPRPDQAIEPGPGSGM